MANCKSQLQFLVSEGSAYILPLWFFLSFVFFTPNLLRSLNESKPNFYTYSLMTAIKKFALKSHGRLSPTGLWQKPLFGTEWTTSNFDREYLCNRTWYQQSESNSSIYRKSPNLVKFSPQTAKNGWRLFAHPTKVCAQFTSCRLTFQFNYIRQMAPMVDADAKNLVSIDVAACWALPCI